MKPITKIEQLGDQSLIDMLRTHPMYEEMLSLAKLAKRSMPMSSKATSDLDLDYEADLMTLRGLLSVSMISRALSVCGFTGDIPYSDIISIGVDLPVTIKWKIACYPEMDPNSRLGFLVNEIDTTIAIVPMEIAKKILDGEISLDTLPVQVDSNGNIDMTNVPKQPSANSVIMAANETLQ